MNQVDFYKAKLNFETDSWDLYESMQNSDNIAVIDARSDEAYNYEHIPSAVNIPHRTMSEQTTAHLSKDTLYITYCDGIGCSASTQGALKLAELGFKVKELLGGLDWWRRDGYATEGSNATPAKASVCGC